MKAEEGFRLESRFGGTPHSQTNAPPAATNPSLSSAAKMTSEDIVSVIFVQGTTPGEGKETRPAEFRYIRSNLVSHGPGSLFAAHFGPKQGLNNGKSEEEVSFGGRGGAAQSRISFPLTQRSATASDQVVARPFHRFV